MSMAHAFSAVHPAPRGGCEFLTRAQRSERCRRLAEQGWVVARIVPVFDQHEEDDQDSRPGALGRGGLREALEGAVEISLALRGALPPEVSAAASALPTARDQMFRVRTLGATGLCLVLPELRGLCEDGMLDAGDSTTLAVWQRLCDDEPLWLLFDDGDRDVSVLAPQRLADAFARYRLGDSVTPSWADDARAMDDEEDSHDTFVAEPSRSELDFAEPSRSELETLSDELRPDPADVDDRATLPGWHRHEMQQTPDVMESRARVMPHDPLEGLDDFEEAVEEDAPLPGQLDLFDQPPPRLGLPAERCAELASELIAARGPKPVRVIEELFRSHYVPLSEALARGLDDPKVEDAVASWRASFEKSYTDGFTTMRLTGKRPTMVLDAPDLAARIGRLNGARAVQLVLIDSMRYDLGQRVRAQLTEELGDRAACVEETLMWSALPTVTPAQLRLLARGPRGLREADPASESADPLVHRDGSVTALARVRIGRRDLLKLDVVESRLREAGPGFDARLDAVASEVCHAIARHCESLQPRTLLFVFGDHGFVMPAESARTTGPASQGGASPEEVLVGAQAWLIGSVH
jgi:hypothetical protein